MKALITIATVLALASPALAAGGNNGNSGGSSSASAVATGGNAYAQGGSAYQQQGQIQGQSLSNSVQVDGTAIAPGVSCPLGFSIGTIGASAGLCLPTVTGNSVAVANAYVAAGRPDLAVTILNNTPVARRAMRSAPAASLPYLECACVDKQRRIMRVVRAPGFTQAQANAACAATM